MRASRSPTRGDALDASIKGCRDRPALKRRPGENSAATGAGRASPGARPPEGTTREVARRGCPPPEGASPNPDRGLLSSADEVSPAGRQDGPPTRLVRRLPGPPRARGGASPRRGASGTPREEGSGTPRTPSSSPAGVREVPWRKRGGTGKGGVVSRGAITGVSPRVVDARGIPSAMPCGASGTPKGRNKRQGTAKKRLMLPCVAEKVISSGLRRRPWWPCRPLECTGRERSRNPPGLARDGTRGRGP